MRKSKELNPRKKPLLPTRLVRGGSLRAADVGNVDLLANTCQLTGPALEAFLFDKDERSEDEFKDSVKELEDLSVVPPKGVVPHKGSGRRPRPTGAIPAKPVVVDLPYEAKPRKGSDPDPDQLSLFEFSKSSVCLPLPS